MKGEVFGTYKIVSELGRGGMGVVYLAEHRHLPRKAAIKVLMRELSQSKEVLDRFFAEARASAMIEHPGIVHIIDCDIDPKGNPFIVMECLEGESLKAHLERRRRLPVNEAALVVAQIAEAMAAAHDREIIHRDLKPENVFLVGGGPDRVKILDFGIAKLGAAAGASWKTQTGALIGTPIYMSPEQCRGAPIDARTDTYSLGCMLYELLAGQPPFMRDSPVQVLAAHIYESAPDLQPLAPETPAEVVALCARMMDKQPSARPQTMREVAAVLRPFVHTTQGRATLPVGEAPAPVPLGAAATTFGQSAAETIPGVDDDFVVPRGRARYVVLAGGVVAVAAVAAVFLRKAGPETTGEKPAGAVQPPPAREPVAAPVVKPPVRPALAQAGQAAAQPVQPVRSAAAHRVSPPPAAKPRMRTLLVTSDPPDALLCLEGEPHPIGRAGVPIVLPVSPRKSRLHVYVRGHRTVDLTVAGDKDLTTSVRLRLLTDEDLQEPPPCR